MRTDDIGWQTPYRCVLSRRTIASASRHRTKQHDAANKNVSAHALCAIFVFHGKGLSSSVKNFKTTIAVATKQQLVPGN